MSALETWGISLPAILVGLAVLDLVVCLLSVMIRTEKTRPGAGIGGGFGTVASYH